ncbi:hypothetical protein L596_028519 [Steinernema carpocapsae]|uniref:RING-type domain-containing protein n=1 Tax=Steinernema carpocapsae TaxID=34508 RepID=A0A4U5LYQ7_STECR|nr:hypothetical protein L596_028519 [Steinernema carpocapsae]
MDDILGRHEKTLQCPICFNVFDKPVQMACGHTYCRDCLKAYIDNSRKRDVRGGQLIDCALCRETCRVQDIPLNINWVVQEATEVYKKLKAMKHIKCSECASIMDNTSRFFLCDTCIEQDVSVCVTKKVICGACGLTSHKSHEVRELQKATENDRRKRRAKVKRNFERPRSKVPELDDAINGLFSKVQSIRSNIGEQIKKHEEIDARFEEPVMFERTLEEIASESKDQSTTICRWIQSCISHLSDMERQLPNAPPPPPALNVSSDVVTISDDEEEEQEESGDDSNSSDSLHSILSQRSSTNFVPKLENESNRTSIVHQLLDSSFDDPLTPSTSSGFGLSPWGMPSSFDPHSSFFAAHMQQQQQPQSSSNVQYPSAFQGHSNRLPAMYPGTAAFPKPVPGYSSGRPSYLHMSAGYPNQQ